MNGVLDAVEPALRAEVTRFVHDARVPGAAAGVVVEGRLAWSYGAGVADLDRATPVDLRTLFAIGSVTKTITATAILQLRDRGLIHLDDPVVRHVPAFARARNPFGPIEAVTIERLLTHTAGLSWEPPCPEAETRYPFELLAAEHVLRVADQIVVENEPGTVRAYSNVGYQLLGEVVAAAGGMPYADHVAARVLAPLGMSSTGFGVGGALAARAATGYDPATFDDRPAPARSVDPAWLGACGGLWSSVEDLALWVGFHLEAHAPASVRASEGEDRRAAGDDVLSADSRRRMHRQTVVIDAAAARSQGLGWAGRHEDGVSTIGHAGGLPGFSSFLLLSPGEGVGVIVLANGVAAVRDLAAPLLRIAGQATRGAKRVTHDATVDAPEPSRVPLAWRELLGDYRNPDMGDRLRVEVRDGALVRCPPGDRDAPAERLLPTRDPLRFTVGDVESARPVSVVFVRHADGRIGHLQNDGWPLVREGGPDGDPGPVPGGGPATTPR